MSNSTSQTETRLELFQAVSKAVNASLILDDIFNAMGQVLQRFLPFQRGLIVILDESQNSTRVLVSLDEEGNADVRSDSNLFAGYDALLDKILQQPEPQHLKAPLPPSILTQVWNTPVFEERDSHPSHEAASATEEALIVPLVTKGMVIGCMSLVGFGYSQHQLNLLQDASDQLTIAVENARLYWQTQNQAGRELLINQITKAIRQSLDIQQILETTVAEVGKVLGVSRCLIHYWGHEFDDTAQVQQYEYTMFGTQKVSEPQSFCTFERELFLRRTESQQQYNPFILNDIRAFETRWQPLLLANKLSSMAVFPILLDDRNLVGTISLHQCDAYRAWISEEIELLLAIAEHVSVGLHQANLFTEGDLQRQQIAKALAELQQTQMQLVQSEKMAVLGQFVAGIAHEVNTPLGTMMANDDTIQRCIEALPAEDPSSQKYKSSALNLLQLNRMAGERIQEIVKNLRNFARLDESDLKQVNLHDGLDATLLLMERSFIGKAKLIKQYGEIPTVECFPGLLNQVFMNLLVNALHSLDKPGTITLQTTHNKKDNTVSVRISDTGKGIAPEHLPRIFDPGFTTKGVGVGTGLGLALCYRIVEKHHGQIDVQSTVGQGTTMCVTVPIRQP